MAIYNKVLFQNYLFKGIPQVIRNCITIQIFVEVPLNKCKKKNKTKQKKNHPIVVTPFKKATQTYEGFNDNFLLLVNYDFQNVILVLGSACNK